MAWKQNTIGEKSEIFTAMKIHTFIFCVVTPSCDVVRYQRFGVPTCLHFQGEVDGGSKVRKT
jgi:hypothetical protein